MKIMKICNICHKISATDQDHLDCVQKISNNPQDLAVEMKAILEHLVKGKDKKNKL